MPSPDRHMQCMEIWGGNVATENAIEMSGLDAWVYSKPFGAGSGGGDVYYVSACATGRITRLLLADVSGHGEAVAKLAQQLRKLMQRYVNFIDQRSFVVAMNEQFSQLADGGLFATAIVSTYFAPTRELTVCIAGHPPPLVYRRRSNQWSLLGQEQGPDAINLPLGIDQDVEWTQIAIRLDPGDVVIAYTDSLTESKASNGEFLNPRGLLELARQLVVGEPSQLIKQLLDVIASQHENNLSADDVSVLLFQATGDGQIVPLRDRFLAPFRIGGGVVKSLWDHSGVPLPQLGVASIGGALIAALNRFGARFR